MRRALEILPTGLLLGLALVQTGCQPEGRSWVPPEERKVTIASDPMFVWTDGGDYLDGYLAVVESEFQGQPIFMALEIVRYAKDDRLVVTGRFDDDNIRILVPGREAEKVPVFVVERAVPNVPKDPTVPTIK